MNDGAGSTLLCLRDNSSGVVIINYNSWEGILIFEETDLFCSKQKLQEIVQLISVCVVELKGRMLAQYDVISLRV
jgi:hypothetical protein